MAFFIVQHGLSLAKDQDPEKGLSPQGIEEANRIALVARNYGVQVGLDAQGGIGWKQET